MNNAILSLDLGTNSIHGILAKYNGENKIEIISADTYTSDGIKCGAISDISAAEITVDKFLTKANELGFKEVGMICAVRGNQIEVFSTNAGLSLKDDSFQVSEETISNIRERLEETTKISDSQKTIEIIPQKYKLDNNNEIKDPIRMKGKYLELSALVVVGDRNYISNIEQVTPNSIFKYGYTTIANAENLISNDDKNLGCVLVDIGGMTTGVVVYVEGKLTLSFELPFGSDYITRDIVKKFKITPKEAKRIKETYGVVLESLIDENSSMEFEYNIPGNQTQKSTIQELIDIIKPQVEVQLIELEKELTKRGVSTDDLIGGFILTGGGSLLKGIPEAFAKFFKTTSKYANFTEDDFVCSDNNIINSQIYTTALSVLKNKLQSLTSEDTGIEDDGESKNLGSNQSGSFIEKIRNWFKEYV